MLLRKARPYPEKGGRADYFGDVLNRSELSVHSDSLEGTAGTGISCALAGSPNPTMRPSRVG